MPLFLQKQVTGETEYVEPEAEQNLFRAIPPEQPTSQVGNAELSEVLAQTRLAIIGLGSTENQPPRVITAAAAIRSLEESAYKVLQLYNANCDLIGRYKRLSS